MTLPRSDAPYQPRGAARELFGLRDPELLLSGPAGTGKSRACLEKLHLCALKYAGMRGLIVRQTRVSLTDSALVTFEEKVLPARSPLGEGPSRATRRSYRYPNGSELTVAGLDRPSRVMSTEYDLIYAQEAIELTEEGWEALTTRLRNGVMPYQQLLADTNPSSPSHWLKQRCDSGRCRLLESRHEDNPAVTPEYLARLDQLTGARWHRLRWGRWVQAEGIVYDEWDPAVHLLPPGALPPGHAAWPRYWAFDFGFTNPFVWQEWAEDPDGRLYLLRELYETGRLVEDLARDIRALTSGGPTPRALVCDHDAEDRATLERHLGLGRTIRAHKDVSPGIQAVKSRLLRAGDGKPRLYLLSNALCRRDASLAEAGRPCRTQDEFDGYVWEPGRRREEPCKRDDHGLDALRYVVAEVDGLGRKRLRVFG
jgi:phage terminase large subunit